MRSLKGLLKGLFGLLALVIGVSIIVWILYNEIIHRLPDYRRPPLAGPFGIAPVMIGVGVMWLRGAVRHFRE